MNKARLLNGYRVIYKPNYEFSMTSDNWKGYIYEHIYVAHKMLGRPLKDTEVVHHLNGCRTDNRMENLLVLERSQHAKLHMWLNSCGFNTEKIEVNGKNCKKTKYSSKNVRYCPVCGNILQRGQTVTCSVECSGIYHRKVERPSKEQLEMELKTTSMVKLGKKYGVSGKAIEKWAKRYGIYKPTCSRAWSTLQEGSETSGEVKSS